MTWLVEELEIFSRGPKYIFTLVMKLFFYFEFCVKFFINPNLRFMKNYYSKPKIKKSLIK